LNPRVDDIPEGIGYRMNRILLLTMGKVKVAASGCYCPENVLLRSLLRHLIVKRSEVVIVDMEAGIEHFTRGTADSVDAFIVVVEPGQRSIQTARTVFEMAKNLGVQKVFVVANKVRGPRTTSLYKSISRDLLSDRSHSAMPSWKPTCKEPHPAVTPGRPSMRSEISRLKSR